MPQTSTSRRNSDFILIFLATFIFRSSSGRKKWSRLVPPWRPSWKSGAAEARSRANDRSGSRPWGGGAGRRQFAFSWAAFPKQSWDETWLHGYLARINKRHGRRMLTDRLLETAGPRRKAKLAKLYEMGL